MRALWLADVLRAAGLKVVENDGWQERGKELDSIEGHVAHHTASPMWSTLATNLAVVVNGNSVAPGPIANLLLWRDGTYHVIAAGRANHAGAGGPLSWLGDGLANRRTLGTEAVNDGVGETWAPEMLDAYELGTAAILTHLGLNESRATTHHEWAPTRKIDPAGPTDGRISMLPGHSTWDPDAWRARIALRLEPPPVPVEEDDMSTARLWRDARYKNGWLIGTGNALHLSSQVWDDYAAAGVPVVVQVVPHEQMLSAVLYQSGVDRTALVKA